jgi:hypothetical protein
MRLMSFQSYPSFSLEVEMRRKMAQATGRWATHAAVSVLIATLHSMSCVRVYAAEAEAPPCSAPVYRQFDFWLGEWDVFEQGGSIKEARAIISSVQNGCGLREQYDGTSGSSGESLSMYDPTTSQWQQTWISSHGQVVVIHGARQGEAMILSGTDHSSSGQRLVRGVWKQEGAAVRETAERSSDNGKTWTPWFDLSFRKRSAKSSQP